MHRPPRAGEQEVVDQGPVASDRLSADAGGARPHVGRPDLRDEARGLAHQEPPAERVRDLARAGPPPAAREPRRAGPAQAAPLRDEQRRRADQDLAGDRAREVHAEERQRRVRHRVDLAAHEVRAAERQVRAAECDDAHVRPRAGA